MLEEFEKLYGQDIAEQKDRYAKIVQGFASCFRKGREISFYSAPGRTEIGGNHTDHNHGHVLAAAVNLDIVAAASENSENVIRLKSEEYPNLDCVDLMDLGIKENERGSSAALLRGICARCVELGYKIGGFDSFTSSQVLKGSGLSSSAAFEVLIVTMISHLFNGGAIEPVVAAQISQYAENVYFGKPCGLMDQTASAVGGFTAIDFENPKQPLLEKIDFDLKKSGYALCITDTGGSHANLTADYAAIPAEMKAVAKIFGKEVLRDVNEQEFMIRIGEVRRSVGDRAVLRAMHFFADDKCASLEADALRTGDFETFKALSIASGDSSYKLLQNVFACSNPSEQGISLALAISEKILKGHGAWRVHGGGFAGTIQAFVPFDLLDIYKTNLAAVFGQKACHVLSVRASGGVRVKM
jgi:galactokinase